MSIYDPQNIYLQPEAYYSVTYTKFSMPQRHFHARCEIMYILAGKAVVEADSESFELTHGQYIFIDENLPHRLNISDARGCSIMNIEFSCRSSGGIGCIKDAKSHCKSVREFLSSKLRYFIADGSECLGSIMKDLISHLEKRQSPDSSFIIGNLLERMICELAESAASRKNSGSLVYVRRAAAYIAENYQNPLATMSIAKAAGVNRSYLQSLFKGEFGCSIMKYVTRFRINRAKFLLTNTRLHIADVAVEVGFNSRQNFALAFLKTTGLNPSVFRKQTQIDFNVDTGRFMTLDDFTFPTIV